LVSGRPTIKEVAERAGVSIATVSRVMNGRDDVSQETRDLVARVIGENGYRVNRSARGLSGARTGLVGVLVPLVYPAYFSGILAGAAEALSEQDMRVVLSPTGHEHDREVSLIDRLMHGLTDGA
jgi:LacI family transcriptional regulator